MFKAAERLMAMGEDDWERHANPWSVYTRFSILPLIALAVWSRAWLGWWALLPFGLVVVWIWVNPRIFPRPAHTRSWAAKVTLGERVFLARSEVPIPPHHVAWGYGLSILSVLGLLPFIYGIYAYAPGWALFGLSLTMGAKTWFGDRMVWLWEDMKHHPAHAGKARG